MLRDTFPIFKGLRNNRLGTVVPQLPDTLLLLFFWSVLFVLSGLGMAEKLSLLSLGRFISIGLIVLAVSAVGTILCHISDRNPVVFLFASFITLVSLPAFTLTPSGTERLVMLDLYFVLVVASPAFLWIWPWRLQAICGFLASSAVAVLWMPTGSWVATHSVVLVVLSAILATLVQVLRARESIQRELELYYRSQKSLDASAQESIAERSWNIALLQLGLVLLLVFVDIAFVRDVEAFPFLVKVYGVLALVIAALVAKASQKLSPSNSILLLSIGIGFILSLARVGYTDLQAPLASLPLVYLAFVLTLVPWTLSRHIAVVWSLLVIDILVKASYGSRVAESVTEAFGVAAIQYRAELSLLTIGCLLSVMLVKIFQHQRVNALKSGENSIGTIEQTKLFEGTARNSIERRRGAVAGLLIFGVIACSAASQLLSQLGEIGPSATILTWVTFFILWTVLLNSEKPSVNTNQFWLVAAFQTLLLLLWPCLLLFIIPDAALMWLFWPVGVFVSLSLVPWRLKELLSLFVAFAVVGLEIVYDFDLDLLGVAIFVCAPLLGALFSLQLTRRVKERHCLSMMPIELEKAPGPEDASVLFASYLRELFSSSYVCVSMREKDLLVLGNGTGFGVESGRLPMRRYLESLPLLRENEGVYRIRLANWLPSDFTLFDDRFGLLNHHHGIVVELETFQPRTEDALSDIGESEADSHLIFVSSRFPFFEWSNSSELRVAETLAAITAGCLKRLEQEQVLCQREKEFESRAKEREFELGALVHDINNTVQDLTLLCDSILEKAQPDPTGVYTAGVGSSDFESDIERIAAIARSVATVVSDAKRKRELEKLRDLRPRELVEVTRVLSDIVMFARIRAERKRITVDYTCKFQGEVWIRISVREHLETILRNLLNNAITYSEAGSSIWVTLEVDQSWVTISVADNGPGIREDEREAIFSSGFRGSSGKGTPGGLGLGLAQSRRVAESAGGSLTVEATEREKGANFKVRLPRQVLRQAEAPEGDWALLVDDQPTLTDFYSRLVTAMEILPCVADSVDAALDVVDRQGKPSMVITDIHLGASNGLTLVAELRARFGMSLPILVISGLSDEDVAEQAREAGASDFVAKPIGQRALYARIQSVLPGSESSKE